MSIEKELALKQLDRALQIWNDYKQSGVKGEAEKHIEMITIFKATISRLAPLQSEYQKMAVALHFSMEDLVGVLRALRADYEAGYIESMTELIHADIFTDFLEMARYLLDEGYKDSAAVIAGGILEEHLRKLCEKSSIQTLKPDGKFKKVETMNAELASAGVYSKGDQKNVTAWYGLRTNAAHGHYDQYTKDQVALMVDSIRDFITRNPA
jgi:uncharacterized protein (DUF2164 family)